MQEIFQFAAELNFTLPALEFDGKIHRFDRDGKKNAWYIGFRLFNKNGEFNICIFGDWKTGETHEYKPLAKVNKEERDNIKRKMKEASEKAEKERLLGQEEACHQAEKIISQCKPSSKGCEYLDRKKIDLCGALTTMDISQGRILVIPMRDIEGKLWGLQRIFPDGSKFFLTCQKTSDTMFVMGDIEENFIYICEGFATGASIRMATDKTVAVAFNAGNLVNVARNIRRKYPNKTITICGDVDSSGIGQEKANEAAKVGMGNAIFPKLKEGTDFNDLHVSEGIEELKIQLSVSEKPEAVGYIPLGFDENTYFFYDLQTRNIKKTSSFSEAFFFELMPKEYWESTYPSKRGIDWSQATSDIIQLSKKAGPFDSLRIRGTGVWLDGGRTIINTGKAIMHNGEEVSSFSSRYVYVQTKNRMLPVHPNPLTVNETLTLRQACEDLKWTDPKRSWPLLAGWISLARIAGALPIRPHIWLTGSAGTGKSTVMDRVIRPALGSEAGRLYLQGGTTEAGIRQSVKADSLPIIFDEMETTNESSMGRTQSIIELLRQTWSHTHGHVVKGSAGGTASHYAMSFSALVSSIRISLDNDADRSRFSILELAPHGNDDLHWQRLKLVLKDLNEEYGERLFSRMTKMIPVILQSYETFSAACAAKISQRFGQQHGMLLSGFYALMSDSPVTAKVANETVDDLDFSDAKSESEDSSDELEALNQILSTRITLQDDYKNRVDGTIAFFLSKQKYFAELRNYGILSEPPFVYVANSHATLKKLAFERTRWANNWAKSLARLPGAISGKKKRIDLRSPQHCVAIPTSLINEPMEHVPVVEHVMEHAKVNSPN